MQSGSFFANFEQDSVNERFRPVIEMFFQETETAVGTCTRDCGELGIFHEGINLELIPQFIISQFKGAMVMAKVYRSYAPLENAYEGTVGLLVKKKWRHLVPVHSQLPIPTFSYHDQLKPYIFS